MKGKAIIGGAGPAGITAAVELLEKTELEVVITEKDNIIGGISRTIDYKGNKIDIGGHRFFSKSKWVNDFWSRFISMPMRERKSRILFGKKFFDYPISFNLKTLRNIGVINCIKIFTGYLKSHIIKRKECSLEDFYINRFGEPLYQMFFESYTHKVWGLHPSELSADWGTQRVKGLSIGTAFKDILCKGLNINRKEIETSLIEEFKYPQKGPGQLWDIIMNFILQKGGQLLLENEIEEIHINEALKVDYVVVKELTGNRVKLNCDVFFSSLPIKELISKLTGIQIPEEVFEISQNLIYRDFITLGLLVTDLKIKDSSDSSLIKDNWIYIQEKDVKMGRIQIFNNWSSGLVQDSNNTVWLGLEYFCKENDDLWSMSDNDFINMGIDELVKMGFIMRDSVLDSVRIKMKKAYPTYYGAYYQLDKVKIFLNSIENLFCIGRNGQHRYNNMDHSMLTAKVAVESFMSGHKDKAKVWMVNSEKTYHEIMDYNNHAEIYINDSKK